MSNIYRDRIVLTIKSYLDNLDRMINYYQCTNNIEINYNLENMIIDCYDKLVILADLYDIDYKLYPISKEDIDISKIIKMILTYKSAFDKDVKNLKCIKDIDHD